MKLFGVLLFSLVTLAFQSEHKYYVSLTEVTYNNETNKFEIATKVFYDDLEVAIFETTGERLQDGTEKAKNQISNYIKSQFALLSNEQPIEINFIGTEDELDAIWIYFESNEFSAELSELTIKNTVLTEFYAQQSNIVNFFPNKDSKKVIGMVLNRNKQTKTIKL